MAFLSNDQVLAHCRNGAMLAEESDGRVLLCTSQGRDLGLVDRRLFDRLAAAGALYPRSVRGFHALRQCDDSSLARVLG